MGGMIEGIFMPLTKKEADLIWEKVKDAGYEINGNGAKKLFLDYLQGEEGRPLQFLDDLIRNHPELVQAAIGKLSTAGGLAGAALSAFLKKKAR